MSTLPLTLVSMLTLAILDQILSQWQQGLTTIPVTEDLPLHKWESAPCHKSFQEMLQIVQVSQQRNYHKTLSEESCFPCCLYTL